MSIRDRILAARDHDEVDLPIPEWGVTVIVRSMSARDRANFLNALGGDGVDLAVLYPSVLSACLYDPETGERLFTMEEAQLLLNKNGAVIERIAQKCLRVSKLDAESLKEEGARFQDGRGAEADVRAGEGPGDDG